MDSIQILILCGAVYFTYTEKSKQTQQILLFVTGLLFVCFFYNVEGIDDENGGDKKYTCENNQCVETSEENGTSLEDCQKDCTVPNKYKCNDDNQCVEDEEGDYDTMEDCEKECKDIKYECKKAGTGGSEGKKCIPSETGTLTKEECETGYGECGTYEGPSFLREPGTDVDPITKQIPIMGSSGINKAPRARVSPCEYCGEWGNNDSHPFSGSDNKNCGCWGVDKCIKEISKMDDSRFYMRSCPTLEQYGQIKGFDHNKLPEDFLEKIGKKADDTITEQDKIKYYRGDKGGEYTLWVGGIILIVIVASGIGIGVAWWRNRRRSRSATVGAKTQNLKQSQ